MLDISLSFPSLGKNKSKVMGSQSTTVAEA